MNENKYDERVKDRIMQEIYEEIERQDWGGAGSKVVIRVAFSGKLKFQPIEVQIKQNRRLI